MSMYDEPDRDPLDHAAEIAACRLYLGQTMYETDWDALKQKATNELQVFSNTHDF